LTPPVAGALFLAAFVANCLRGALPPVDLRAVCFVRAMSNSERRLETTACESWKTDVRFRQTFKPFEVVPEGATCPNLTEPPLSFGGSIFKKPTCSPDCSHILLLFPLPLKLSVVCFYPPSIHHGSQGREETRPACKEGCGQEVQCWPEKGLQESCGELQDLHL